MSKEEAIEIINRENDPNDKKVWELFPEYREALDMAIKALSQEPCDKCVYSTKDGYCQYDDITEVIPPLKPCDDAVEQLKKYTHDKKNTDKVEISVLALNRIIKALSQEPTEPLYRLITDNDNLMLLEDYKTGEKTVIEKRIEPCDDAVSREAILNKIKEVCFSKEWTQFRVNNGSNGQRDYLINFIEKLSPVTQKSGKWIKKEYWKPLPYDTEPLDYDNYDEKTHSEKVYHYYCSECDRDEGETKPTDKYCPNCGAKMESEK